ncbi:hypothetical protein OAH56_00085 [Gammaproteobacteria bacterium]|nr:hypothetical protein [Gammaproteobacteria bacterium]
MIIAVNFREEDFNFFFLKFHCFDARLSLYPGSSNDINDLPRVKLSNLKKNECYTFVITDIQHILIFSLFRYIERNKLNIKWVFVQHGEMNHESTVGAGLMMNLSNKILTLPLLFYGFKKSLPCVLFSLFKSGTVKTIKRLNQRDFLSGSLFWNNNSTVIPNSLFRGGLLLPPIIVGSPDVSVLQFIFDPQGPSLYVSQPLVSTSHISQTDHYKILDHLDNKFARPLVLLHPKMTEADFDGFNCISLAKNNKIIGISRIIGHFSSALLSFSDDIPLIIDDFNIGTISSRVEKFKKEFDNERTIANPNFFDTVSQEIIKIHKDNL